MIRLATPISTLFADRFFEKEIVELSDCLECRDHSAMSSLPGQELFHFEAELIHEWTEVQRTFIREAVYRMPDLRLVTFHAASSCSQPILDGRCYVPGGVRYTPEQMCGLARENTLWLRSFLPRNVGIGLENNNYYPTPAYDHVTDGDFLTRVTEENNLHFLFDIAHARVTAHNRGLPLDAYRASLPLGRMIQVHVCRPGREGAIAIDAHLPPGPEELADILSLSRHYSSLRYVTIEYYEDAATLLALLKQYRDAFSVPHG